MRWPNGLEERWTGIPGNTSVTLTEGRGTATVSRNDQVHGASSAAARRARADRPGRHSRPAGQASGSRCCSAPRPGRSSAGAGPGAHASGRDRTGRRRGPARGRAPAHRRRAPARRARAAAGARLPRSAGAAARGRRRLPRRPVRRRDRSARAARPHAGRRVRRAARGRPGARALLLSRRPPRPRRCPGSRRPPRGRPTTSSSRRCSGWPTSRRGSPTRRARRSRARSASIRPLRRRGVLAAQMMIRIEFFDLADARAASKALAEDPRLPRANFLLGQNAICEERRWMARSRTSRRSSPSTRPTRCRFYRVGEAWARKSAWDHAIPALQRSLWINPFYSGPYIVLGRAYLAKGQAADGRGHAAAGRRVRSEQQGRALPARAGAAAARARRRRHASSSTSRRSSVTGRTDHRMRAAAALLAAVLLAATLARQPAAAWPVTLVDVAASAGLVAPVGLRRAREEAVHHRDQRRGRRLARRRRRRVARCARAERHATRRGHAPADGVAGRRRARRPGSIATGSDGTFADVTAASGLGRVAFSSSVCAGDYDNDGRIDVFTTAWGTNALYRNVSAPAAALRGRHGGGRPAVEPARAGAPAAPSSTTTATAGSTCSSRTTSPSISRRPPSPARA